ncbi:hypothetical protein H4R19_000232 [Coemansia spiralis]|nr:hypothetical protein H4R19_000232 [Coemansia spiralis]
MDRAPCVPIAQVSRECSMMDYECRSVYRTGDRMVRHVGRLVKRVARPYGASGKCLGAMRALACASVYPECTASDESIPGYSRMLMDISRTCRVPADELSQRLVAALEKGMAEPPVAREPPVNGSEMAVLDVLSFAAFAVVVWYLGFLLVHQWGHTLRILRRRPASIESAALHDKPPLAAFGGAI